MRLYEYKTKYLTMLALYQPKNEEEKAVVEDLTKRLHRLRKMTVPDLIYTYSRYKDRVSSDLREIILAMIQDAQNVKGRGEE